MTKLTKGRKPPKPKMAERHAQPHIRKAMAMYYEYQPFEKAKVIGPGASQKRGRRSRSI